MTNLTRYEMFAVQYDGYKEWNIGPADNGPWVKFDDIKEFLLSALHNKQSAPLCYQCGDCRFKKQCSNKVWCADFEPK